MQDVSCYVEMNDIGTYVRKQRRKCLQLLESFSNSNGTVSSCPPIFDGVYCWPATPVMNFARKRCLYRHVLNENVTRLCSPQTDNLAEPIENVTVFQWQNPNYGRCSLLRGRSNDIAYLYSFMFRGDHDEDNDENDSRLEWWHLLLRKIDYIGYGLSTFCLIVALLIFWKFSQLQDTRVKLHINLFTAMLSYAIMCMIHSLFYGCKIFFTMLVNGTSFDYEDSQICRGVMTLTHYFKLSIFTWLMIEGWYFYNFISRAPYHDYISIKPHLIAGWGLPVIVIIPWVIVHKYSSQTNFCWVDVDEKINIVAIPIFIIVLINLCFFILNVRIIFIKMKSTYMSQKRLHYWRWMKSSLMLVPLFGSYDILYSIWPWVQNQDDKILFLLIIRLICAFQGSIVATLYCFTNGHVKREVKRAWRNWKLQREIGSEILKNKSTSTENMIKSRYLNNDNGGLIYKDPDYTLYF